MTMTTELQQPEIDTLPEQDEESLLLDQLQGARHQVEALKKEASALKIKQNQAEHDLGVIEQAVADYMEGNGLLNFNAPDGRSCELGKTYAVDVEDITSVPYKYIRLKPAVEEINKALIQEAVKRGELVVAGSNWLKMKESNKITIKNKGSK